MTDAVAAGPVAVAAAGPVAVAAGPVAVAVASPTERAA